MRHLESDSAEKLRLENEDLRRQLEALRGHSDDLPQNLWKPSSLTILALMLILTVVVVVAFLAGYLPLQKRTNQIAAEAHQQETALPRVEVIEVGRASSNSELELPGNIQAITEAPILARADGYIGKRMVDIGDRVQAGQVLAQIEAPELDDQALQIRANREQAKAALDQAEASFEQGKADAELARVTAQRFARLAEQGISSKQDNDQYQAQYQSKQAALRALDRGVSVQRANLAAAEANLSRLLKISAYRQVKAPFAGVVTLRNVDTGALVTTGSTLMFRIAQTETLRMYVNVPQSLANSVRVGQTARLRVTNVPGREFTGKVVRTAGSLDPTNRTLLTEVEVPNGDGLLFPGQYAIVNLISPRVNAPLLVPSEALIVRGDGTNVAVVRDDSTVHLQRVLVGRDYGDRLEVLSGLKVGDRIVPNPGDVLHEGAKVEVTQKEAEPVQANAGK
jgi:RND family efflux transporter MFP subunit